MQNFNRIIKVLQPHPFKPGFIGRRWWIILLGGGFVDWIIYLIQNCTKWPDGCTGFAGKTFWDVAELFIIPITLAGVAAYLDRIERKVDRELADKRARLDRELTVDNQQEIALQSYIDSISKFVLHEKILNSEEGNEIRKIVQAKTLTTISRLNDERKSKLIDFICDLGLISGSSERSAIISLNKTNLQNINILDKDLKWALFSETELQGSKFNGCDLQNANFFGALLMNTVLIRVDFAHANLKWAQLIEANLQMSNLEQAYVLNADLRKANLKGSFLKFANFTKANLSNADFEEALIEDTVFTDATMPDGKIYDPSIHTTEYITSYVPPNADEE